ncbi:AEC family transporter [Methylotuvimicrobium buryatense]|nr:AEC family transporter [Methylotuvimicrobium buryatense]
MIFTLLQMAVLIACGIGWRWLCPGGLSSEQVRPVLTSVVYYLFLPAMVLEVLWRSDIGVQSLQYTFLGTSSIAFAMICIWLIGRALNIQHKKLGAIILVTAFPNVTYLGLPVLEETFGHWARSVAIQIDLFATAPFLFTAGIMTARHFGENHSHKHKPIWLNLNAPPFWAALLAVILNLNQITAPEWLLGVLQKLSAGVVPIMLFSLGLALSWQSITLRNLPYALPIILIKLFLMPWFALQVSVFSTLDEAHKAASVLEMAMPSMVLGIVFCDRYRLDSALYAMAVTLTTVLSMVTLPFWYRIITTT